MADLTGDGRLELIVGRENDQLTVYNRDGGQIWARNPFGASAEVRSLAIDDLDNDGQKGIIVGRAGNGRNGERQTKQVSVYQPDGSLRPGWSARHEGEAGYGANMYNENLAIGDLNNDGFKEIYAPTDVHYITALDADGNQLFALDLPTPRGDDWNGGLGAPTVANIDADADFEVVIGTVASGVVAYDLPGTAGATCRWCTGRGSNLRSGVAPLVVPANLPPRSYIPLVRR